MSALLSRAMSKQEQYRPSRRSWIKLWTHEWLTGTIRWQLTKDERSIWADLLCLAGMSRFPGVIASGFTSDDQSPLMGYPVSWLSEQCRTDPQQMEIVLHKMQAQERLTLEERGRSEAGQPLFMVTIVNWNKYQSEYMVKRQRRKYNEPARSDGDSPTNVRTKSKKCPPLTPPEEVEGEKKEKESLLFHKSEQQTTPSLTSFAVFWEAYPRKLGVSGARKKWATMKEPERQAAIASLEAWKTTEQWRDESKIPYGSTFLNQSRWEDTPSTASDPFNPEALKKEREKHEALMRDIAADEPKPMGRGVRPKT